MGRGFCESHGKLIFGFACSVEECRWARDRKKKKKKGGLKEGKNRVLGHACENHCVGVDFDAECVATIGFAWGRLCDELRTLEK